METYTRTAVFEKSRPAHTAVCENEGRHLLPCSKKAGRESAGMENVGARTSLFQNESRYNTKGIFFGTSSGSALQQQYGRFVV